MYKYCVGFGLIDVVKNFVGFVVSFGFGISILLILFFKLEFEKVFLKLEYFIEKLK